MTTSATGCPAGQAVGLLLLTATVEGVSASLLNQPVEHPSSRVALRHELGVEGHPQALLRLGYAPDVPATPRRPVDSGISTENHA